MGCGSALYGLTSGHEALTHIHHPCLSSESEPQRRAGKLRRVRFLLSRDPDFEIADRRLTHARSRRQGNREAAAPIAPRERQSHPTPAPILERVAIILEQFECAIRAWIDDEGQRPGGRFGCVLL